MDRSYLKGERGINRNVYETVKDYSEPIENE